MSFLSPLHSTLLQYPRLCLLVLPALIILREQSLYPLRPATNVMPFWFWFPFPPIQTSTDTRDSVNFWALLILRNHREMVTNNWPAIHLYPMDESPPPSSSSSSSMSLESSSPRFFHFDKPNTIIKRIKNNKRCWNEGKEQTKKEVLWAPSVSHPVHLTR